MKNSRWILILLIVLLSPAWPSAAAIQACHENPGNGQTDVDRNFGIKKLIEVRFGPPGCVSPFDMNAPELPLSLPLAATVTLAVSTRPTLSCVRDNANPGFGQCGFSIVSGQNSNPGVADTVQVVFNDLFVSGANVTISLQGIQDNKGDFASHTWAFRATTKPPRQATGLELVFDSSESMGFPAVPGSQVKRIDVLRDASRVLFQMLEGYALPGDQIGLVTFGSNPVVFDPTPGGSNLEAADVPANRAAIQEAIRNVTPYGSTSIGGGLREADRFGFQRLRTPTKSVVLFSDGEQNSMPCVQAAGQSIKLVSNFNVSSTSCTGWVVEHVEDYPSDIRICPITAGRITAPGFILQQAIAHARCDDQNSHIRDTDETLAAADLETFFAQAMAGILIGDKLEVVSDVTGQLGAGATQETPFLANEEDVSLSFLLSWAGAELPRLPFRLEAPDGTVIDTADRTRWEGRTSFTSVHLPQRKGFAAIRSTGTWKIQVGGPGVPALAYHLVVLLDNTTLASQFSAPVADPGTGEPIPVRVKLSRGKAPVVGAEVKAQVSGPQEGLGDVLSSIPGLQLQPVERADGGRVAGDLGAASQAPTLLSRPDAVARLADRTFDSMVLLDNGAAANGDARAGDGIYSGLFRGATEEGHYHFTFQVQDAKTGGGFQRSHRLSVFVRPKPDPAQRQLRVAGSTADAGGSLVVLRTRPQDALGNLLGPGYLGALSIDLDGGTLVKPLQDNLDGSYEVTYRIPDGAQPKATLKVLGQLVTEQPFNRLPTGI